VTVVELILESPAEMRKGILLTATLAGLANALALLVINSVAQAPDTASLQMLLVFALAAVTYIAAARISYRRTSAAIEAALHALKVRIVKRVERTDLARLERIGATEILDRITENVSVISDASTSVASLLQALSIFLFALLYLLWLSPGAFLIIAPLEIGAIYLYRSRREVVDRILREHAAARVRFLDAIMDLLRGAKEIKLSRARSREACADFVEASISLRDVSVRRNHALDDNLLFLSANLYVLLGGLVFVMPKHIDVDGSVLSKLVAAILFIWGSVQAGLGGYAVYINASHALSEVASLEGKLEDAERKDAAPDITDDPWRGAPGRIEVSNVEYEYPSVNGNGTFRIGPIDLTIEPGEILFIVGGNGAGKSTLLKVLTGLYAPTQGTLRVGGILVQPFNAAAYRETISAIFSDFHLFSRVYGLLNVDPDAVRALLREMQIEHKTSFEAGRFTRQDLSTGQRKRLAMVVALLEDRPIFVLDEWAADQDPAFRRYFYESMLPALKRRGKTVIAVSHDDRYFHCADRVMILEYGVVRAIEQTAHEYPPQVAIAEGA
jgi:putative pyoverdin transport system ATP-binding/permease protein